MTSHRQTRRSFLRNLGFFAGAGFLALGALCPLVAQTSQISPFHATIYVQGAANWIPHADGSKVLVLFPNSEKAIDRELTTALHGEPLCHHYAVVQTDAGNLGLTIDEWIGFDVTDNWLQFDAQGAGALVAADLKGLPPLEAVLNSVGKTFTPWDGSTELLRAGLVLHQGVVGPHSEYLAEYEFSGGTDPITGHFSNVHRIELGLVTALNLRLRSFDTGEDQTLEFTPPPSDSGEPGEVEVWVRHFCNLEEPEIPSAQEVQEEEPDWEFPLNYALQADAVIKDAAQLPFPLAPDSGGGTIRCMGAQTPPLAFTDPFE